jgi:hypothetical protein
MLREGLVRRGLMRRPLVLGIYEPRWFMRVLEILGKRRIEYSIYDSAETLPYYSVLYTDYELFVREASRRSDVEIIYDPGDTLRGLEESILATMLKREYNEVTIGIDPGSKPYVIVLGDNDVLDYGYVDMKLLSEKIKYYIDNIPARRVIVWIGMGSNGLRIADTIRGEINAVIELVDEYETTPRTNRFTQINSINKKLIEKIKPYRNKDAYAALKIALRKGLRVE